MQETIPLYLFISYLTLFAIVFFLFLIKLNKKMRVVTPFEVLSLLFVITGLVYGLTTAFGYALICAGVIFFVADFYLRTKNEHKTISKKKK